MRTAAYARYSSENQRAASIDDQLRNIRAYCARLGWPEPVVYSDEAISGARNDRPGYRRLLSDAQRYDVILVDDLSRLSRDSVEAQTVIRRMTFAGVRVIGVSDGLDTGRKGHKADVGLRGLMSELYLDDLREKTHRGLTGRALAGASAGGLPYGYRVTGTGQRAIDEAQAAVVRRIFADYIAGHSPRDIAAALNREGVPSPRGSTWAASAIRPDAARGLGILANPIYTGRVIWNRTRWVKHPETGRRVRQERPQSEWIVSDVPELAIVDRATWNAAQARHRGRSRATGTAGRPARHLLSGLLRCGDCGGPLVMLDAYAYGCSVARNRGTCSSTLRVSRREAEHALLAGVREQLLSEEALKRFQRAAAAALKRQASTTEDARRRLAEAARVRDNVLAAIRAGIITPSTKAELERAEAEIAAAERALQEARKPEALLPRARERMQKLADTLADAARRRPAAREALQALIGQAVVRNCDGALVAEIAPSQISVVAGACSALYLSEPVRIPLQSGRES